MARKTLITCGKCGVSWECPIKGGSDHMIQVLRDIQEVFRDELCTDCIEKLAKFLNMKQLSFGERVPNGDT